MTAETLRIIEDTRCQASLPWPAGVEIERRKLDEADYSTPSLLGIAAIELKRDDFAAAVGAERERFDREIERLRPYRWKAIVVAEDLINVYRGTMVHPHAVIGSIASWYARHDVPTLFVSNDTTAARLICGLLRRWQERIEAEMAGQVSGGPIAGLPEIP